MKMVIFTKGLCSKESVKGLGSTSIVYSISHITVNGLMTRSMDREHNVVKIRATFMTVLGSLERRVVKARKSHPMASIMALGLMIKRMVLE
jgi:hypothetical protein